MLGATTDGSAGTTAYTYDNLYRVITAQVTGGGANQLNTLTTYAYDLAGNKRSMSYGTNANSETVNILYDYFPNGWMKSVNNDGNITYYDYYKTSEKKLVKYPNNTETAYEYNCYSNPNNLTSKMNHYLLKMTNRRTTDKAVISFFGYPEYDLLGNRLKMNELRGQHVYAYDNLYRLKAVTYPDTRNVLYAYDEAGNRTSMVETEKTGATPVTTTYQYNEVNEMMSLTKGTDTTNYTYDQDGNTLTKANTAGTTYYHWNLKGELSATELPGNKSNVMEYDMNGMRIRYTTADNVTTNYVYEGLGTVMEIVGTRVTKKYYSGISMVIPENPGKSCKQTYYYLYDGLGDVVNLTDEAGNLVQTYYFDAFGKSTNVRHDCVNKKQFTGKEIDEDSGLHYFGARYYDAEVGRFISEDSKPNGNLYTYCSNNPINKVDPDGRDDKDNNYMTMSQRGIWTLMKYEGNIGSAVGYNNTNGRYYPYDAKDGMHTIGHGTVIEAITDSNTFKSTLSDYKRNGITNQEAMALMMKEIHGLEKQVNAALKIQLSQNEFDSIISVGYNVGFGGLMKSGLIDKINSGADTVEVSSKIKDMYPKNSDGSPKYEGHVIRREREADIYENGNYVGGYDK